MQSVIRVEDCQSLTLRQFTSVFSGPSFTYICRPGPRAFSAYSDFSFRLILAPCMSCDGTETACCSCCSWETWPSVETAVDTS